MRVLLIDDDFTTRFVMESKLKSDLFTFVSYENGNDFLADYAHEDYADALILLDVNMPVIGGFELAEKLLELNHPTSKIAILTDLADVKLQFEQLHLTTFLAKADVTVDTITPLI